MVENPDPREDNSSALSGRRLLILFPHMVSAGGALAYTLRLAGQLHESGAKIGILALKVDRKCFTLPKGVEVISLDGPLTSSLWYWLLFPYWQSRLRRMIAAWNPDMLIPQVFPANWWGWLYKRKHRDMKLVWVCHEPSAFIHSQAWIRALRPWWKSLLARTLRPALSRVDVYLQRYCDRTVANSRFTAGEVKRIYNTAPDAIARPGIDFQLFSGEKHLKERAILTVARLTKFKRIDFLLEVFAEVLKDSLDLEFIVVGTGEDETLLRSQARKLGLESKVTFCGEVDPGKLADLYQRSALYLHGSVDEPFGMAPLEAIAYGTPVVAHKSGGPMEFINQDCGRLIASLDPAVWAKEITAYLDLFAADANAYGKIQECARRYDWQCSLQPALQVVTELCETKMNP